MDQRSAAAPVLCCRTCAVRHRCAAVLPPAEDDARCPVAAELARAADEEAAAAGWLVALGRRMGLSERALDVVAEDARHRHDLRAAACQLVLAVGSGGGVGP